ncbi:hypothetical protein MMC25_004978 [Agyrium rufum]|nr:hypothetical protein [Agyrium rufum]
MPSNMYPDKGPPPGPAEQRAAIEACLSIQRRALTQGKRPFAAILLAPDHQTVLLTHQSVDHVNHAESCLARMAATHFTMDYLWRCTLVSAWEPCAMCAATIYWANIGRLIYAASEERLGEITGEGNEENPTMSMPCREVFAKGQKDIEVWGPVEGMEDTVVRESDDGYWRKVREANARSLVK